MKRYALPVAMVFALMSCDVPGRDCAVYNRSGIIINALR
jgi:hypothetical protein